jgi:hypothetical protein
MRALLFLQQYPESMQDKSSSRGSFRRRDAHDNRLARRQSYRLVRAVAKQVSLENYSVKQFVWLQRPPRVQWAMKVIVESEHGVAVVRTWFHEYGPTERPPCSVTIPLAEMCERVALAALASNLEDADLRLEIVA